MAEIQARKEQSLADIEKEKIKCKQESEARVAEARAKEVRANVYLVAAQTQQLQVKQAMHSDQLFSRMFPRFVIEI